MNDNYVERQKIYTGPISIVYKAKDARDGKIVALKVVDVDFLVKPHNIKREIEFLKLQRQVGGEKFGVLLYIDSFKFRDDDILVTEYYDIDLNSLLDSYKKKSVKYDWSNPEQNKYVFKNQFPTDIATFIFYKLSTTLKYLHEECQIIHRDIKPSNIFFKQSKEGEVYEPVLGDFGILYDKKCPPSDEPPNEKYTDVSTGCYKAPELCFGATDYDTGIDIWSLGVLVSRMYSNDGFECIKNDSGSDLGLIYSILLHFGTPNLEPSDEKNDKRYWPEMKGNKQFEMFNFSVNERKSPSELIPRCPNNEVSVLWDDMMVYQSSRRPTARDIIRRIESIQ